MKTVLSAALLLLCAACKEEKVEALPSPISAANQLAAKAQLQVFFTIKRPMRPQSVVNALAAKHPVGTTIAITGRVGGSKKPIGERASLMLMQGDLVSCIDSGKKKDCGSPWDLCSEDLSGKVCTIQVKGPDGQLFPASLRGLGDLKELSTITVAGRVSISDAGLLVIDATQIYVDKP